MISYIYSGSFNPLHSGHMEIINRLLTLDGQLILEGCVKAVGKEERDKKDLIGQMGDLYRKLDSKIEIVSSQYSLFLQKIMYYYLGGCRKMVFAIGWDTYDRIKDSKNGGFSDILKLTEAIPECEVSFLVFERDGKKTAERHPLIHELSFDSFSSLQCDVSSSQIRKDEFMKSLDPSFCSSASKTNPSPK